MANQLDGLKRDRAIEGLHPTMAQLIDIAIAVEKIDLRVQDVPMGPTREAIQEAHLALAPLLEELSA